MPTEPDRAEREAGEVLNGCRCHDPSDPPHCPACTFKAALAAKLRERDEVIAELVGALKTCAPCECQRQMEYTEDGIPCGESGEECLWCGALRRAEAMLEVQP